MNTINLTQIMNKKIIPWFYVNTFFLMLLTWLLVFCVVKILVIMWWIQDINQTLNKIDTNVTNIQQTLDEWFEIQLID